MRMEQLETRQTRPKSPTTRVIQVYKEMTTRRYNADWSRDPEAAVQARIERPFRLATGFNFSGVERATADDWRLLR